MVLTSQNPATGEVLKTYATHNAHEVEAILAAVAQAAAHWRERDIAARAALLKRTAAVLRARTADYARLITLEMGKPIKEARGEIEKCAWGCEFYADNAAAFLADEEIATDATRSLVAYQPLGTVLAIMPWNFPFWQVFRFAAPALMAGNTAVLKHAANVPQCALAVEGVFREAGLPENIFRTLLMESGRVEGIIKDPRIHAVTLTGSEAAGRQVAAQAGAQLKKTVLELGGSDAFVVLPDADLELAATVGVAARYLNGGQSCIAAKRFILTAAIHDEFLARFAAVAQRLKMGDPLNEATDIGPLARLDLRDALHAQVQDSIKAGATLVFGGDAVPGAGAFYTPAALDRVEPGMRAYREELFGPVAIVLRARDEKDALRLANDNRYGLGGSVWTRDLEKGERFARQFESGAAFVNGLVKSDPRLPFGGIKASGYGRELSAHGIREFVNIKTLWMRAT